VRRVPESACVRMYVLGSCRWAASCSDVASQMLKDTFDSVNNNGGNGVDFSEEVGITTSMDADGEQQLMFFMHYQVGLHWLHHSNSLQSPKLSGDVF